MCTPLEIKRGTDSAIERNASYEANGQSKVMYEPIRVYVESSGGGKVTLRARPLNSPDNDPSEWHQIKDFDWSEANPRLWRSCPSEMTMENGRPAPKTYGSLYLSKDMLPALGYAANYTPKWPDEGGGPLSISYDDVAFQPTRVTIQGYELRSESNQKITIELFNRTEADPGQTVSIQAGRPVMVRLSADIVKKIDSFDFPTIDQLRSASEIVKKTPNSLEAWKVICAWSKRCEQATNDEKSSSDFKEALKFILDSTRASPSSP
jgi:hypothetical protein